VNLLPGLKINIYPNPVGDLLTIQQFGNMQNRSAVLYNANGNMLRQIKLTSASQEIDMRSFPKGVYFVKMEDGTVIKITKQ
jgi:hypothetical protein